MLSRWRFLFLVFGIIVFIIAYSVGAILVKINASQADFIKKDFETKIKGINQYCIFANNFKVALGTFLMFTVLKEISPHSLVEIAF
jgi:uncharacterized membrane protein SpoIIM required for sporulation